MTTPARQFHQQMVHYLRKSITFADGGTTVTIGTIPAGSVLIKSASGVAVTLVFNGNSSNVLDVGPSTDTGTNLWGTSMSLATAGFVPLDEAVSDIVSVDTIVQAAVTSTAAASAGTGEIIICYIPDNDM